MQLELSGPKTTLHEEYDMHRVLLVACGTRANVCNSFTADPYEYRQCNGQALELHEPSVLVLLFVWSGTNVGPYPSKSPCAVKPQFNLLLDHRDPSSACESTYYVLCDYHVQH
jgi:hypothetical protein